MNNNPLTRDEVIKIVGPLNDDLIAAIIATGANATEVTEAFTWLHSNEDLGPNPEHRLSGRVAEVYEILTSDVFDDEDEPRL